MVEESGDSAQQLEDNFLAWITMAAVFITAAVIIEGHKPNGRYYFLAFFAIGIILLIISSVDYIQERNTLNEQDINIPNRLDYLFIIVIITIIISFIIEIQTFFK